MTRRRSQSDGGEPEQHFQRTLIDTTGRAFHTQAGYLPDVSGGQVGGVDRVRQVQAEKLGPVRTSMATR